mmetsp:Transcript_80762/g.261854  ORF Transcript_80762/g.261854 Transcript_80762/m.261854 type:complete len:231 (-) Transcript_80762:23-715(-)
MTPGLLALAAAAAPPFAADPTFAEAPPFFLSESFLSRLRLRRFRFRLLRLLLPPLLRFRDRLLRRSLFLRPRLWLLRRSRSRPRWPSTALSRIKSRLDSRLEPLASKSRLSCVFPGVSRHSAATWTPSRKICPPLHASRAACAASGRLNLTKARSLTRFSSGGIQQADTSPNCANIILSAIRELRSVMPDVRSREARAILAATTDHCGRGPHGQCPPVGSTLSPWNLSLA